MRPAILTGLGGSALQGIPVVVPIACESQMAAITRPSGYFRKAERRAAGSARCGGGIRASPEASGRERRPEGSAPQPHESRPWRESTAWGFPGSPLTTVPTPTGGGEPTVPGRAGDGHSVPTRSWVRLASLG